LSDATHSLARGEIAICPLVRRSEVVSIRRGQA
jgi:hypothetical protein